MEKVIPIDILEDRLKHPIPTNIVCHKCKEVKEGLYAHPYAYDEENAEVIYAVLCPKCKEVYFIRD